MTTSRRLLSLSLLCLAGCQPGELTGNGDAARPDARGRDLARPDQPGLDLPRLDLLRPGPDLPRPDAGAAPCSPGMAHIQSGTLTFCIDRYEAALQEKKAGAWAAASPYLTVGSRVVRAVVAQGTVPQGYISGIEASTACSRAGKRLCSSAEWLAACQGAAKSTYPYGGHTHKPGACNDVYKGGHPVVDFFGTSVGVWDSKHMNDPGINKQAGTVAKGGAFPLCKSAQGVFDLHGNLHEWVSDAAGTFRGGFYADAKINGPGCLYKTTAHAMGHHDYSTGFRCCAAAK